MPEQGLDRQNEENCMQMIKKLSLIYLGANNALRCYVLHWINGLTTGVKQDPAGILAL